MKYVNLDSFMGTDYSNWIFDKIMLPVSDSADVVNILYSAHSGEKWISPICFKLNGDEEVATDETKTMLAKLITAKYKENWDRLYSALFADYNPIENYSMNEIETTDRDTTNQGSNSNTVDTTNTGKTTESGSRTDTTTSNSKQDTSATNTSEDSGSQLNQVYAEDSEDPVNASRSESNGNSTSTDKGNTTTEGTDTTTGTNTDTTDTTNTGKETSSGSHSDTGTEDVERTLQRKGNIGVTTSQQMIEAEIALRKHNYYDIIFKDVDDLLCLSIY